MPNRSPGKAYVEGDASSASYFLAGAAVTGGTVTVEGCGTSSLQVLIMPCMLSLYLAFKSYYVPQLISLKPVCLTVPFFLPVLAIIG